jgi:uncharacterized Fe-S center protein
MNKTSKVFFKRGSLTDFLKMPQKILDGLKKTGFAQTVKKNEFIGLKIHFGEKGNKSYINPSLLVSVARFLKKRGAKPFFFETNTLYRGNRLNAVDHINLAYKHGFGKLDIPVIIGDGIKGNNSIEVEVNKKHFQKCFVAQVLEDIDALVVLSHFTGHMLTGFGGSVKNLGMGCASRRGKMDQHCQVSPQIHGSKCVKCGLCVRICPVGAIEKKEKAYCILKDKCIGCAQCISVCPTGAVGLIWSEEYDLISEKMAEYAFAAARNRRCVYVNFCLYLTKECDCMNKEKKGFLPDLGILFSDDPVSVDKASIDLILKRENQDVLTQIHPKTNYLHHLQYAKSIGLGSLEYKLVEI